MYAENLLLITKIQFSYQTVLYFLRVFFFHDDDVHIMF